MARLILLPLLALGLAACNNGGGDAAASSHGLHVEAYDAPIPKAPLSGKIETGVADPEAAASPPPPAGSSLPAAASDAAPAEPIEAAPRPQVEADPARPPGVVRVAAPAPAAPRVAEPPREPYDPFAGRTPRRPAPAPPAEPGFRVTLETCRRAERQGDPLAATPECAAMLRAGVEQQRLCAKAFEDGDDRIVLSEACRQAGRAR